MAPYKFTWPYQVTYLEIVIPGEGSLVANPGDVRDFDSPPDSRWIPVVPPALLKTPPAPVSAKEDIN